ncbi:MAG: small acid-soluble spore protein SspI [Bacilli bacterium]
MDSEVRRNIKQNFKEDSVDILVKSVEESVNNENEILLPGLGVFFEILWNNSSNLEKTNYCQIIKNNMK